MYNRRDLLGDFVSPKQMRTPSPPSSSQYQVLEEIGRGSFGAVRKVLHVPTKKLMVRKEIKYGHMSSKERLSLIHI